MSHQIKSLMTRAEYLKKHIKVSMHSFQIFNLSIRHTSSDSMSWFAAENAEYVWFLFGYSGTENIDDDVRWK